MSEFSNQMFNDKAEYFKKLFFLQPFLFSFPLAIRLSECPYESVCIFIVWYYFLCLYLYTLPTCSYSFLLRWLLSSSTTLALVLRTYSFLSAFSYVMHREWLNYAFLTSSHRGFLYRWFYLTPCYRYGWSREQPTQTTSFSKCLLCGPLLPS